MRPCIRGLKKFSKGCPEKAWDGKEGCPAWKELLITPKNEPMKPKDKVGRCIDEWMLKLKITELGLLEGNQQATESFRNNMSTKHGPKPDPAIVELVNILQLVQRDQQLINNIKQIP